MQLGPSLLQQLGSLTKFAFVALSRLHDSHLRVSLQGLLEFDLTYVYMHVETETCTMRGSLIPDMLHTSHGLNRRVQC